MLSVNIIAIKLFTEKQTRIAYGKMRRSLRSQKIVTCSKRTKTSEKEKNMWPGK
jgi:hypothetical protein